MAVPDIKERSSDPQEGRGSTLRSAIASALVVTASSVGIISTYDQMSQTWDEPTHIAAGLEWLQDGTYKLQTETPPLGRVGAAMGAYVAGARLPAREHSKKNPILLGKQVLYDGGNLRGHLNGARAGVLPFFWLMAICVWLWFRRFDSLAAFFAVTAVATLPPILAHSGLATTDIPFVAVFMVVLLVFRNWLAHPNYARSVALGVVLGLALTTKFTTVPFFAAAVLGLGTAALRATGDRRSLSTVLLRRAIFVVAPTMVVVVWLVFGFSLGKLSEYPVTGPQGGWAIQGSDAKGIMGHVSRVLDNRTVPAPAFLHGLMTLSAHNYAGHLAYALGDVSRTGFWYSYALGIAVKSPLPFLLLFALALLILASRVRTVGWSVCGLMATILFGLLLMTPSRVTIGTRHVLALYPMMAIVMGQALAVFWREQGVKQRKALTGILAALLCWQVADLWRHHPDWVAYFNPLAGRDPGYVLNDSDLDWGQGVYELEAFFAGKNVESLTINYNGSARLCAYDLPPLASLNPVEPPRGWVAISERLFRLALSRYYEAGQPMTAILATGFCDEGPARPATLDKTAHSWIATATPVAHAGRTIRIYYFE